PRLPPCAKPGRQSRRCCGTFARRRLEPPTEPAALDARKRTGEPCQSVGRDPPAPRRPEEAPDGGQPRSARFSIRSSETSVTTTSTSGRVGRSPEEPAVGRPPW